MERGKEWIMVTDGMMDDRGALFNYSSSDLIDLSQSDNPSASVCVQYIKHRLRVLI